VPVLENGLALPEPGDLLPDDHAPGEGVPLHVELEGDRNVVPVDAVAALELAVEGHRLVQEAHPERGCGHGEHEPERDRIERLRAEGPRDEVDPASEGEDPAAAIR
jgi:hypothetical protein